jgi:hypothetical protein
MSDLLALAERVEAAPGPDRELDQAIYHDVLGYCRHVRTERSGAQSDTGFDCLDCGADSWGNKSKPPYPPGQKLHDAAPAYTESLDAAMTLVPEGSVWLRKSPETMSIYTPPTNEKVWAHHIDGKGATPALALTAAALRARARAASTPSLNAEIAGMGEL